MHGNLDALERFLDKDFDPSTLADEDQPIQEGNISMVVPMEDFEYILTQLWKCRKSEKRCEELYEKYKRCMPIKE